MSDERKRMLRTAFQVVLSLAIAAPLIVDAIGVSSSVPIVAVILSASLALTRAMALPVVEKILPRWLKR